MARRTEKQWDAYYDAMTLKNAELIKMDKARLKRAEIEAKKILKEENAAKTALAKVAKSSTNINKQ